MVNISDFSTNSTVRVPGIQNSPADGFSWAGGGPRRGSAPAPTPAPVDLQERFVTLSSEDFALYSDGDTSFVSAGNLPAASRWNKVVFGDNKFVAVGYDEYSGYGYGAIVSEDGGSTWARVNSSIGYTSWRSVAYGNGMWVLVGSGNYIAYSEDLITWSQVQVGDSSQVWSDVVFGGGKFVLSGFYYWYSQTAYSEDGINWTAGSSYAFSVGYNHKLAYGNGVFVAFAGYSYAAYSTNGITWTSMTVPDPGGGLTGSAITFGNGKFVLFTTSTNGRIYVSATANGSSFGQPMLSGLDWNPDYTSIMNSVAYGNGYFIVVGRTVPNGTSMSYPTIGYSTSGEPSSWSTIDTDTSKPGGSAYTAVAYGEVEL